MFLSLNLLWRYAVVGPVTHSDNGPAHSHNNRDDEAINRSNATTSSSFHTVLSQSPPDGDVPMVAATPASSHAVPRRRSVGNAATVSLKPPAACGSND